MLRFILLAAGLIPSLVAATLVHETRRAGPRTTSRALQRAHAETLSILTDSLPHLRSGLSQASAERVAALVLERLPVEAVAIVDTEQVLAFFGAGSDHHRPGQPFMTDLTREVMRTGDTGMVNLRAGVGC